MLNEEGKKSAWIVAKDTVYLVTVPANSPDSPILELIERIYYAESVKPVSQARTILRGRIRTTYPPTFAEREAVKVTAKRLDMSTDQSPPTPSSSNVVILPEAPPLPSFKFARLQPGTPIGLGEIPGWLENLKLETTQARVKWSSDRAVSAILVDRNDHLLALAWNTNAVIRTRHAEANLCASLSEKIPIGAKLYVSLKPCRMCAARIWECAEDPATLNVIYLENDPGPLAQGTLLDACSPARVRYLGTDHPLFAREFSKLGI